MHPALRLGLEETRRRVLRLDRRTLVAVAGAALVAGLLAAAAPDLSMQPAAGLHVVEADASSIYLDAAREDPRFRVHSGDGGLWREGRADLFLTGDRVGYHPESERSRAAVEALEQAVQRWNEQRMAMEPDAAAAFPVQVTLVHERRDLAAPAPPDPGPDPDPQPPPDAPPPDPSPDPTQPPDGGTIAERAGPEAQVQDDLRPGDVEPPFPVRSLLLTFAYLVPASLVVQMHASSLHSERVQRRGLALLSTPLGPAGLLAGRSLPAAAALLVLGAAVSTFLGAGWLGFLASAAILFFLLAVSLVLAVMARSPRELTMLLVASTTLLNVFLFLPAMFPALPPVAFLSPIHVVATSMQGGTVAAAAFLYATLPLTLAGAALCAVAVGAAREEVWFSVRGSLHRLLQAMETVSRGRLRVLAAGALAVPFAVAAQLLLLVLVAVLGHPAALLGFLVAAVLVEETLKALVVWARARTGAGRPVPPWLVGILCGTGFFLAEKGVLVLGLVGFPELPFGREAMALMGAGSGLLMLTAPLVLHVATATLVALGAARGRGAGAAALAGAVALHALYNRMILAVAA